MDITGIILAGGNSSRMGNDKGLTEFQGKPLIQYSIDLILTFTNQIIISSNQEEYTQFGFPVVEDIYKNCGPIGGLHAALKQSKTEWNVLIGCDLPFLNRTLIDEMSALSFGYEAIIPSHKNGLEPLAGLYHKNIADFLEANIQQQNLKLQKVLTECNIYCFDASSLLKKYPNIFRNINTPDDLIQS